MRHFFIQHRSRHWLAVAGLSILPVIAACSADSATGPQAAGQFTANVSGSLQSSLTGSAAIVPVAATVVDSTKVPPGVILGLLDGSSKAVVAFQWQGVSTIGAGTYTVGPNVSNVGMVFDTGTGAAGSAFDGVSGSVTISSYSSGTASGTFNVTAAARDTGAQVTISGTFTAPTVRPTA